VLVVAARERDCVADSDAVAERLRDRLVVGELLPVVDADAETVAVAVGVEERDALRVAVAVSDAVADRLRDRLVVGELLPVMDAVAVVVAVEESVAVEDTV
jgi:hypothetical protein